MTSRILQGDCLEVLKTLPDESVHCVVTSPPYWGLRDYGVPGQLGLEKTPEEFVSKMVEVFREVRRVLRSDGTLWLNIGDSYNGQGARSPNIQANGDLSYRAGGRAINVDGLKAKDLCGIPWMLAFALRADGWYLRQDIIWAKPNPMPESVRDRCTKSHEYIFLLTKSANYYYDAEAVKEAVSSEPHAPGNRKVEGGHLRNDFGTESMERVWAADGRRNKRSVWTITTKPFSEAHFATFPPEIPEICIKAGTSEQGCCAECGAPWERVLESSGNAGWTAKYQQERNGMYPTSSAVRGRRCDGADHPAEKRTIGWKPTCTCYENGSQPCTVLDPFSGAGTTGLVASRLGRDYIGVELNPDYIEMSTRRIVGDSPLFNIVEAQ